MNLKEILTISGYSGLFKMVSQTRNGVIVESLIDKKRMPAYASYKISSLEDIAVFTDDGEIRLAEVIKNIFTKENGGPTSVNPKAGNDALKAYFAEVLPNFDHNRVYVSDIKRLMGWYNLLQANNLLELTDEAETPVDEPMFAAAAPKGGGEEEEIQLTA
jgi:hypothetical protein